MSDQIVSLLDTKAPVHLIWYDLPVLGRLSEVAAKAAIAAGYQGQYLPVHQYLMRNLLRPGNSALAALADRFSLDPNTMIRDVSSSRTNFRLEEAKALAATFRIVGTPGLVVGSTMVMGRFSRDDLDHLIQIERDRIGAPDWCR